MKSRWKYFQSHKSVDQTWQGVLMVFNISPSTLPTMPCIDAALLVKEILMAETKSGLLQIPGNLEGSFLKYVLSRYHLTIYLHVNMFSRYLQVNMKC